MKTPLITAYQAAEILGIPYATLMREIRRGELPAVERDGNVFVKAADIERAIDAQAQRERAALAEIVRYCEVMDVYEEAMVSRS
jgi:predicted site-specific integrase-resolvase